MTAERRTLRVRRPSFCFRIKPIQRLIFAAVKKHVFGLFLGGRLREHPWSMVHGPSMVYGRCMHHVPCSLHDPGRGWHDVEAEREVFFSCFRIPFGRFFSFLAEQGGCWVGVGGRGCHDVEAERESFFPVFWMVLP